MASKLWVHEPDTFFLEAAREISEKWNFFVKCSVPENFQRENFSGLLPTESLRTQDSENVVGLGDRASVLKLQPLKVRLWVKNRYSNKRCPKKHFETST